MRWAVLFSLGIGCSGRPVGPTAPLAPREVPSGPDALARGFALRALVAEARGELGEADRSWAWVRRLDRGADAAARHGAYLRRQGRLVEAEAAWDAVLAEDPGHPEAGLARALGAGDPGALEPFVQHRPCRVAGEASGAVRARAEALCVGR